MASSSDTIISQMKKTIQATRDLHLHILGANCKLEGKDGVAEVRADLKRTARLVQANTLRLEANLKELETGMRDNQLEKEKLEKHVNSLEDEVKFVKLSVSRGVKEKEDLVDDMNSLKEELSLSQLCVQSLGNSLF